MKKLLFVSFVWFLVTASLVNAGGLPAWYKSANVSKGKQVYGQTCVACHGATGKGDGPAAVALNPKPRDLSSASGFKQGCNPDQILRTIEKGVPGTTMVGFKASIAAVADRQALSRYVFDHFLKKKCSK